MSDDKKATATMSAGTVEVSGSDVNLVAALKELLQTPAQKGGRTTRNVLVASMVYHEDDFPVVGKDPIKTP